jgi:uncharacterized protein (DUF362 family)
VVMPLLSENEGLDPGADDRSKGETQMNSKANKAVVSIVRIRDDRVGRAVEEALDLLGGVAEVTRGRRRIMLKPNLVADSPGCTTKPAVVEALAKLMIAAGKEVLIGEGSAAASDINSIGEEVFRTGDAEVLNRLQQKVFDVLGYTELARSLGVQLINLHTGEMAEVHVPNAYVYDRIKLHRSLTEIDMLCSVPMMKTHVLATVTLGMKNLIGLYPGTVYKTVRAGVHDTADGAGSLGIAYEIIDMVGANKLGLVVVDGSMAMEGDGPGGGPLVKMDLIVAGTNPLATDMIAATIMGFETEEVPTFACANKAGMRPAKLDEIEVRGARVDQVRRTFLKPNVVPWTSISKSWGVKELVPKA